MEVPEQRQGRFAMSVVVNTNSSAIAASNNLSRSNAMLQRSLSRLSSGSKIVSPSDDAGGLAVSMKMQAAIKRSAATATNLANATSFLQTQDGVLETASQILSRIGELKVLSQDVTKNDSDKALYEVEFSELQSQLEELTQRDFNGVTLFGGDSLSVTTNAEGTVSTEIDRADLGSAIGPILSTQVSGSGAWENTSLQPPSIDWEEGAEISGNNLTLKHNGYNLGSGRVKASDNFDGPTSISFDYSTDSGDQPPLLIVARDSNYGFRPIYDRNPMSHIAAGQTVQIIFDGDLTSVHYNSFRDPDTLNASNMHDGADEVWQERNQLISNSYNLDFRPYTQPGDVGDWNDITLNNLRIVEIEGDADTNIDYLEEADVTISSLDLSSIDASLESIAGFRATNGAKQNRLQFASDQLTVNEHNLEEANSRIMDVDVAEESTRLARANILVQAGAAMLGQASASTQIALKLLG